MRILMLGTGAFAVPTLRALAESRHEVAAVVTRPARSRGGGGGVTESPVSAEARRHGLPILAIRRVSSDAGCAQLSAYDADLLVVCDFGEILAPEALAVARLGGINLHASLLPKYRGAAPVQWAVYHGEHETGVTVIQMTPSLDAGPCLGQVRTSIGPQETAVELEGRLAEIGAALVCRIVDQLAGGRAQSVAQDDQVASRAPRLRKEHGRIDWSRSAVDVHNQVRAMQDWPTAYTHWQRPDRQPLRLILHETAVVPAAAGRPPGTVIRTEPQLVVATGREGLHLLRIQPAGKRPMDAETFLRGYRLQEGDVLRS